MWTREQLKTKAKDVLRGSYWWAFLVCLIFTLIVGFGNGLKYNASSTSSVSGSGNGQHLIDVRDISPDMPRDQQQQLQKVIDSYTNTAAVTAGVVGTILSLVFFCLRTAYTIFVSNPLEVGYDRYFLDQSEGRVNFSTMFAGFTGGKYMNRVKVMFFKFLYTFLWTLLFIVPGIIKGYSYFLIPYILADNPDMSTDRAFEISMKTMDGEKWDLFVLQLSFIGWQLLGLLCCCVGIYFVNPYVQATMAEFYLAMRQKAISTGIASAEEFCITESTQIPVSVI